MAPPFPPVEPPPSRWQLGAIPPDADDLVGLGADLAPGTILAAYRHGMFPMHVQLVDGEHLGWWSPDPRGVIPLDGLRMTRSLRRSCGRYRVAFDTAFEAVIDGCADPTRHGRWINPDIRAAYLQLHTLGWAHSIEAWSAEGELAGGLYGVAVGGFFAGESMFHRGRDASKVALVTLVERWREQGGRLLDVQWATPHLRSLGAVEVPRSDYLAWAADAVAAAPIDAFT